MTGMHFFRKIWRLAAVGFVLAAVLAPAAAWAVYPNPPTSAICKCAQAVSPLSETPVHVSDSSSLPVTGGDIAGLVAIGGGLVIGGLVLRQARRRRLSRV